MHLTRLDLWTKRLVGDSLQELWSPADPPWLPPSLLGELAEQVSKVLSSYEPTPAEMGGDQRALADELALTVYLTTASFAGGPEARPASLASLRQSVSRTLEQLAAEAAAPATEEAQ